MRHVASHNMKISFVSDEIQTLIQQYDPFLPKPEVLEHKGFTELVTNTFRNKVVDHMERNPEFEEKIKEHAITGLTSNFREHINKMVLTSSCFLAFKEMLFAV